MTEFLTIDDIKSRFPVENGYRVRSRWTETDAFSGSGLQGIWFVLHGALSLTFNDDQPVVLRKGEFAGFPGGKYNLQVLSDRPAVYAVVTFPHSPGHRTTTKQSVRPDANENATPKASKKFLPTLVNPDEMPPHPRSIQRLDEGLGFEDSGLFIPWGTPIEELTACESPTIKNREKAIFYQWDHRVLFGIRCDLSASRFHGPPDPRTYILYVAEFYRATLNIHVDWTDDYDKMESGFRDLFAHIESQLGTPTFCYPKYFRGLPSVHWERDGMKMNFAHTGAGPRLSIAQEPGGYQELKAEYQAIRDGRGKRARVEYVDFNW